MENLQRNIWLHRFAVLTAIATFALLGIGGLVTSHEAGMSVPDWPTSYGYNMFLFPLSHWWHGGNKFYEHSHRLFASGVGLLTTILAVWLCLKERRIWMRWLGVIAFVAVVLQGVLGGLRVVLFKDELGIFHATLAQLFFVLICSIALFTSRWWKEKSQFYIRPHPGPLPQERENHSPFFGESNTLSGQIYFEEDKKKLATASGTQEFTSDPVLLSLSSGERAGVRASISSNFVLFQRFALATTLLIFAQLILGATIRHQHAGLAIPDFPLAYGKIWPAMDAQSVAHYNQQRQEITETNPITSAQIALQMTHRIVAVLILICVGAAAWHAHRWSSRFSVSGGGDKLKLELQPRKIAGLSLFWLGLILVQATLGAATIWSNKAADIATAHVLVGALSLVTGTMLVLIVSRSVTGRAAWDQTSIPLSDLSLGTKELQRSNVR